MENARKMLLPRQGKSKRKKSELTNKNVCKNNDDKKEYKKALEKGGISLVVTSRMLVDEGFHV